MTYIISIMVKNIKYWVRFLPDDCYLQSRLEGLRNNASIFLSVEKAQEVIDNYLPKDKEYCVDKY